MMYRSLLPLLSLFLLCTGVRAQTLSGRITDAKTGEPLPFASVYVANTQSGAAANADGYYEVKLAPGDNQVVFQYLGYQPTTKRARGTTRLDVGLQPEALELEQIEVVSGGEDRSYSVIRRAIAKADYHRNQVETYTADVYIKGTGKVEQVGGAIRLLAGKEGREEIDETLNRPFTTESFSEVTFTRPSTYRQDVKRVYQVGDDSGFDAAPYLFTSFYEPEPSEAISPLHPRAFAYYKYELQGTNVDGDDLVHKIKVIPRSPGEDVFEGFLYIVQDDWALHSLDLTTRKIGFKIRIRQNYAEVQDRVWMPVTTTLDVNGSILGIQIDYDYLSTVANYQIEINEELPTYVEVIDEKTQPEAAKRAKRNTDVDDLEAALGEGQEITRKDLRKLMRTYAQRERQERDDPKVVRDVTFKNDSVEGIRDTAAWAALRPVPLTAEERAGYAYQDSVAAANPDEEDGEDEATVTVSVSTGEDADVTVKQTKKDRYLKFSILPAPFFNPVEGYALGGRVGVRQKEEKWGLGVSPRYGFGWEQLLLEGDVWFGKSGIAGDGLARERALVTISGGRGVRQFNELPAIDPWLSTWVNLLEGNNFIRLFRRDYVQLRLQREYDETIGFKARLSYSERTRVFNSANNNWFGLEDEERYPSNTPVNEELGEGPLLLNAAVADVEFYWRPGLDFEVRNGKRSSIKRSAPTISARIRQGIDGLGNANSDFTQLEASYEHRFAIGKAAKLDVLYRGGVFVNNSRLSFADYRHFAGTATTLAFSDPIGSYRLLPLYLNSTGEEYFEAYTHVQFRKLLLTRIPAIHLFGLKENLFVNYLHTPTSDNYAELGYSLDNILRFLRLEFVTSFRDARYEDFGVRIGVSTSLQSLLQQ